jgi:NAD(P)-dependent dehydrogenase (short-subunit alcohol dehydrogenase family)
MRVLITGCTRGIGLEATRLMLDAGYHVYGVSRSAEKLEAIVNQLKDTIGVFNPIVLDLCSDQNNIEHILKENVDFEVLDALINNFGGTSDNFGSFLDLSIEDWDYAFRVNTRSAVVISRLFIKESKTVRDRSIVFLSSVAGVRPGKYNPHYGFMKAGIIHLSKGLANSFGHLGFRVNCISPSQLDDQTFKDDVADYAKRTNSDLSESAAKLTEELMKKRNYKYFGVPSDVSNLIMFLLSEKAKLISGQNIVADCAGI